MTTPESSLRLALPKGRMQTGVLQLLAEAGLPVRLGDRDYRPRMHVDRYEAKLLKPQNIVEMLHQGSRDLGFAGHDWVIEKLDGELVELLDTELDPVRIVAAAPTDFLVDGKLPNRPLVVASEYERLTKDWIEKNGLDATFVRTYGATEVFPPEDADVIVDNTATGSTLRANGLTIFDELLRSSTRIYTNRHAWEDQGKRSALEDFVLLVRSVLDARKRVMLELNVGESALDEVTGLLPTMREATVSPLRGSAGFAVKAAVPRSALAELVPQLKQAGGSDLVVTEISQLVP